MPNMSELDFILFQMTKNVDLRICRMLLVLSIWFLGMSRRLGKRADRILDQYD